MKNMLSQLAQNSEKAIEEGIYKIMHQNKKSNKNLIDEIKQNKYASLITEVKFSSPSLGNIREIVDPTSIAKSMVDGGAIGLSVLTQPHLFNGSPEYFSQIRNAVKVPLLMKDIVIDKVQIDAAEKLGADVILLIQGIFDKKFAKDIDEFIDYAHKKKLLVLLEAHTKKEFSDSAKTSADILGINNRDLDTLQIDLNTTKTILDAVTKDRIIISESGIKTPKDIQFLHNCGADAFLVGSSIMKTKDIKGIVSRLVASI
ncbi:MAG: indole-3-glycerol-phosphate synthase [Nitrososphaera sp.]